MPLYRLSRRRATAPQPNPVPCNTQKSAKDMQASAGQPTSEKSHAETRDRTGDLQIFSLTLSQLSYRGLILILKERHSVYCYNT